MPFDDRGYHYGISVLKPDHDKDISLEKDIASGGSKRLRKRPRTRLTQDNRGEPQAITKTDIEAENRLYGKYGGGKKPALVLKFVATESGYRVNLGAAEIHVAHFDDGFKAFLVKKIIIKRKAFWRQLLSGQPDDGFQRAVKNLTSRDGWFFDGIEWRSLEWVFHSVVVVSLDGKALLSKSYVMGIRHDKNLHVLGTWKWQRNRVDVIQRDIVPLRAPDRRATRFPDQEPMPALRSDENYKQDYDEKGTIDGRLAKNRITRAFKLADRKLPKIKFVAGERVKDGGVPKPYEPDEWTGALNDLSHNRNSF